MSTKPSADERHFGIDQSPAVVSIQPTLAPVWTKPKPASITSIPLEWTTRTRGKQERLLPHPTAEAVYQSFRQKIGDNLSQHISTRVYRQSYWGLRNHVYDPVKWSETVVGAFSFCCYRHSFFRPARRIFQSHHRLAGDKTDGVAPDPCFRC